ncbi:M60 family metallopeptidase [Verrucomicrobiota bacterium sgz303538]
MKSPRQSYFFLPALLLLACHSSNAQNRSSTDRSNWPFTSRATPGPAVRPGQVAPVAASAITVTPAQLAALNADRAKLIEGVKTIPRVGAPGPVVAYGALAFPLATVRDGKAEEAVAAAASMGKGRAVIFGHNGYVSGDESGDLNRLLLNAVRWSGRKEKPRVGLKGSKLGSVLEKDGIRAENVGKLDKKALSNVDVLVMSAQVLTDESEAAALKEFIEGGGGFVAGVTAWAFGQSSGGKDFATAHLGNQVLAGAGLAWTTESLGGGTIEVPAEFSPMLNAFTAITALAPKPDGTVPGPEAIEQGAKTIQLALSAMPTRIRPGFQQLLARYFVAAGSSPVPTKEKPLSPANDADKCARVTLDAKLRQFLAPADVVAHPAAEQFPGRVGANAQAVTKTLTIDPTIPGWHSTGLYADAGAKLTVKLPPECVAQGYALRIGCHTDRLYHLDQWKRIPEISSSTPLQNAETVAASPFGGLVYLVVPDKVAQEKPFAATISGAVESPYFVLGETTDAQWQQIRQRPAPWAELACKGVILTVPSDVAREVNNPTELMQYWQRVVDAEDDLSNVADKRRRPERIVPDVQISAGFMHSGYPIMIFVPQAKEMATVSGSKMPGWGFYHEIGHNHQKGEWTPEGTGEVTCNLFALYVFATVQKQDMRTGHGAVSLESQAKKWGRYRTMGTPFEEWKKDPFLALGTYIQLIDGFGFDALKKVLRSYQGNDFGPLPKNEDEKRDQWMVRYSKIVGKNLGPYFDAWGIPVSSSAKSEIASLPGWMPEKMKP